MAVPGGAATVGSPPTELCRDTDEVRARVTLAPFALAAREVTQQHYRKAMGTHPSFTRGCPSCPVDSVTHHEAAAYCNAMSAEADLEACYRCEGTGATVRCSEVHDGEQPCAGFRLPTEAEWETAARAGTLTSTHGGRILTCMATDETADRIAWYKANSLGHSHPVGTREPNDLGLYDMAGNVYEWTADWFEEGSLRAVRGGSWYHNAEHLRSANRLGLPPERGLSYVGFRCARAFPPR